MDKDKLVANQPAPDKPDSGIGAGGFAEIDPARIWVKQPSEIYDALDQASTEGASKPGADAIDRADSLMEALQDTTGGCEAQGHPFEIAGHEVQHNSESGATHPNTEASTPLRSGQGQSGLPGEPEQPLVLPAVALKPGERSGT
jgi:hypothetical protein